MSFDQTTRNRLQRFVSDARATLTGEFTRQLQNEYGLDPVSASVTPMERLSNLDDARRETAQILRDTLEHYRQTSPTEDLGALLDRIVREHAFTVLNRLAALRMAEARGLLIESLTQGYNSKGFQLYARLAGTGMGERGDAYRTYLFSLFDEFALDLRVLFDRFAPTGRLFPREPALLETLALMNDLEVAPLWAEDETIGWIYQYFNSKEERKKMRDESAAPRNSRELAVRNQFFTPRYVVEFLTDNTLGRIWYEMTKGETRLKDQCRNLVRRPTEIFLQPGEEAESSSDRADNGAESGSDRVDNVNLSQEELLRQPVHIPHRPLEDPREIRVLDPACGSMHFGLYAFDLFEVIYEEAWDWEAAGVVPFIERSSELKPLLESYAGKQDFLRDVPRLIIEHNLHGIDIDPRAVQIAGLSLWLRAQRAWQTQGVKAADRPRIRRSNIVCAEPMPGEEALLNEFIERHLSATPELRLVAQLVRRVFKAMKLAGEAGSLLKIEEEVADAVAEAKEQWLAEVKQEQGQASLFADLAKHEQQRLDFDVAEITDETFWERAESSIYAALSEYAEQAENGGGYQRRLFVEDAARGFAFIDLCRKCYDVGVMNPPFGYPSERSKSYVDKEYAIAKYDIAAAFIDRVCGKLMKDGYVGCISSRTIFFIDFFSDWRLNLFRHRGLECFADFGSKVLEALVETAAFTIRNSKSSAESTFIRLLSELDKDAALIRTLASVNSGCSATLSFFARPSEFLHIDSFPLAYWVPKSFRSHFERHPKASETIGEIRVGLQTGDDFRFIRTAWEVEPARKGLGKTWAPLAKGGEFRKFYDDIHLVINWARDGSEIVSFCDETGRQRSVLRNVGCYYRPGLTYPMRTASNYSPRVLPAECVFNVQGNSMFESNDDKGRLLTFLGILTTTVFESFTRLKARVGDMTTAEGAGFAYTPGLIGSMPFPKIEKADEELLSELVTTCVRAEQIKDGFAELSCLFAVPHIVKYHTAGLKNAFEQTVSKAEDIDVEALDAIARIETFAQAAYRLTDADKQEVCDQFGVPVSSLPVTEVNNVPFLQRLFLSGVSGEAMDLSKPTQQRQLPPDRHLRLEEICRVARVLPGTFVRIRRSEAWIRPDLLGEAIHESVQYFLGCAFGRWDIRFATCEKPAPELPDPFAPLPVCPPGMLQNEQGLPAAPSDVPASYPLRISWPGILVDDKGHAEDIERRIREVLQVIWQERADAIEQEACEIIGVKTLRDYFLKPASFFAHHLQRYSKSRRQAPIYWPLSTRSGEYTLWLYYHRLNDQALYSCVNNFVEPKLRQVSEAVNKLRGKGGGRTRDEEKDFERLQDFERELQEFRDELLRLAKLPWRPNLNDGVQITAAPLWRLFRLPKWQKTLKEAWQLLEKGDYDWAHLAMTVWPQRVVPKCAKDRSLAIAHGVEDLFWVEDGDRWRALQSPRQEIEEQKQRRRYEAGERAKQLLCELARGADGQLSAADVGNRLASGGYDDRELALLLYPERMAEKCWEEVVLAQRLGLNLPAKKTKAAREKFIKEIVARGCAELAPMIEAALDGRARSFAEVWREIESGERDDLPLSLALWPDRVVNRCAEDMALAEQHGLRKFFWVQYPPEAWRRHLSIEEEISNEIEWRRCIAAGLV
jgi:hypothetical protein